MAMHDWNHNGKEDAFDDFMDYQMMNGSDNESDSSSHYSRGGRSSGISTFGAILYTLSGLFWQAFIYTIFDIEVDNVPALVLLILWVVFSFLTAIVVETIKAIRP